MRPRVSGVPTGRPSQRFQTHAARTISKALRLPRRAQDRTKPAYSTTRVGMRG
jgi:hypothetical protein